MASFLPSSGPLSLLDINNVWGRGLSLSNYRGVRWYKANAATGIFSGGSISIDGFYGTGPASPVPAGSVTIVSSQSFVVPLYSVMTFYVRAGAGGGAGGGGLQLPGTSGAAGTTSFINGWVQAFPGGGGGFNNAPGANGTGSDGNPAGGAGGAGQIPGGPGGAGGLSVLTVTNPINGGNGPAVGSVLSVNVGPGGAGGRPGYWTSGSFTFFGTAGAPGGNGSVFIQWT